MPYPAGGAPALTAPSSLRSGPDRYGVLFDLDGVLWDTSPVHRWAFGRVCRSAGLRPVPYQALAGRPTGDAWELVLKANHRPAEAEKVKWLTDEKQRLARGRLRARPPLRPGLGTIAAMARAGVPLGLVSGGSAETVQVFLDACELVFDVVVTASTPGRGKPAPDPYLQAAAALRLGPGQCWALEDSAQGLQSALAAGARAVHLAAGADESGRERGCAGSHAGVQACVVSLAEFAGLVLAGARC